MTNKQANKILIAATGRKTAQLNNLTKPEMEDLTPKLVKMITINSFKKKMGEYWTNLFTELNGLSDEIGALNQVIDAGLLDIQDDIITDAKDLLPDLDAVPSQYSADFMINLQKRVELIINTDVYKLAFTSVNSFGNFLELIKSQIGNTVYIFLFTFIQDRISESVKNIKKFKDTDLIGFVKGIYENIAAKIPYTDTMNLGADADNDPTHLLPWTSGKGGVNKKMDVKTNTISMETKNGISTFPEFNIIIESDISTKLTNMLAETYHSNFIDLTEKFNGIIPMTDEMKKSFNDKYPAAKPDHLALVIDKSALFISSRLGIVKNQFWAKGSGSGIQQLVFSMWKTIAIIPWLNGRWYYAKNKSTATTKKATQRKATTKKAVKAPVKKG